MILENYFPVVIKIYRTYFISLAIADRILALISASSIATSPDLYGIAVTLKNRYLFATGSRTLTIRYRRYGRPMAATAGIFVLQDACCIHVGL